MSKSIESRKLNNPGKPENLGNPSNPGNPENPGNLIIQESQKIHESQDSRIAGQRKSSLLCFCARRFCEYQSPEETTKKSLPPFLQSQFAGECLLCQRMLRVEWRDHKKQFCQWLEYDTLDIDCQVYVDCGTLPGSVGTTHQDNTLVGFRMAMVAFRD